jgi:hypothetical protein
LIKFTLFYSTFSKKLTHNKILNKNKKQTKKKSKRFSLRLHHTPHFLFNFLHVGCIVGFRMFYLARERKSVFKVTTLRGEKSEKATSQATLPVQTPDLWNQEVTKAFIVLAEFRLLLVVAVPSAERELPAVLRKWWEGAVS